jgi:hypothetical protein
MFTGIGLANLLTLPSEQPAKAGKQGKGELAMNELISPLALQTMVAVFWLAVLCTAYFYLVRWQ